MSFELSEFGSRLEEEGNGTPSFATALSIEKANAVNRPDKALQQDERPADELRHASEIRFIIPALLPCTIEPFFDGQIVHRLTKKSVVACLWSYCRLNL
ncbi:MAG: hypothetical protein AAF217_01015 [Pseudomonadota bacterium]